MPRSARLPYFSLSFFFLLRNSKEVFFRIISDACFPFPFLFSSLFLFSPPLGELKEERKEKRTKRSSGCPLLFLSSFFFSYARN